MRVFYDFDMLGLARLCAAGIARCASKPGFWFGGKQMARFFVVTGFLMLSVVFSGYGEDDIIKGRLDQIKREYGFEEWGGKENIPGCLLDEIPISASEFLGIGQIERLSLESEKRELRVRITSTEGKARTRH